MRLPIHMIALAALALCGATAVQASGYHFGSQSASSQGSANAGAIEAEDASVLFYNPAGASRLKGTQMSGVLNVVMPSGTYTDMGSYTSLGRPTGGTNGGKFVKTTAVPHAYMTHQLSSELTAGLGIFVPFGSSASFDPAWAGRYNTISTELKTLALNPSLTFKLSPQVSVGGGLTMQHIDGKLAKGADFGSGALGSIITAQVQAAAAANPGVPIATIQQNVLNQLSPLINQISGNPAFSGRVDVEGKDWGTGFNVGVMFEPDEHTRFGIAYRSAVNHTLKGTAKWQVAPAAAALETTLNAALAGTNAGTTTKARLLAAYTDSDASLAVKTPESLSFSAFHQAGKLALMGDVTVTRHSRFQELRIDFSNALPDSVTPQRWTNTTRVSAGMSYQLDDTMKVRAGIAHDGSPVSDANRTPSIPDGDRIWLSGGLNWKMDKTSSVDVALSYIKVRTGLVNNYDNGGVTNASGALTCDPTRNTSSCATIKGNFKLSSFLLGLQYNRQF
ncbi:MAG: transporter [Burkholderiaceae bacterium]|nr:MAG: transporter [Burkholderiaceae bacterium]